MRRKGLWTLAAAAVVVLGALLVVASLSPATTAGVCSVAAGPVMLRDVPEASGLAVSRRWENRGLLWTHNDSGNEPALFAVDTAGTLQNRVRVPVQMRDWEDISSGRCLFGECLYLGDIGDNSMSRRNVQVYIVEEPYPGASQTAQPAAISLTYPDGPHNAEAMFVADRRIFIVTRDRRGILYRSAATLDVLSAVNRSTTNIKLQRIGVLGLAAVTDAEASVDGASVAVRTSQEVVIYRTADLIKGGTVAPLERIPIDGLREPQGEAVALGENGTVYLASEGRPWNRAGRFVSLQCPTRPL